MRVVVVGRMLPEPRRKGVPTRGTFDQFENACRDIGSSLARHGHTLVVTSDAEFTADAAAVEGYVDVVRKSRDAGHRVELVSAAGSTSPRTLFTTLRGRHPAVFASTAVHTYSMEVARLRVAIEADATILICGGVGTERTAYVALAARRKLVPIASFGGAGSAVLTEIGGGPFADESLPRGLDPGVLSQDWSSELADRLDAWLCDEARQRDVFVVYGRNRAAQQAVFDFLRSLDLNPLEWDALVRATGKGAPYIGEVLDRGFARAQACVVLFTGDEAVRLRPDLAGPGEDTVELQPRPNVLFEAGMALAHYPERTLIATIGLTRGLSDLAGRHYIRLDDSEASRRAFAQRLETIGCAVNMDGDWRTAGDFDATAGEALSDAGLS